MKALLFAALLLGATTQEADAPAPYRFLLHFPADNSLEVCQVYSFSIDYPTSTLEVQDCNPDTIFKNGFE
jgi:hypothetical protein